MNTWVTYDCGGGLQLQVYSSGETFLRDATTGAEICFGYMTGPDSERSRTDITNVMKAIAQALDATREQKEAA
jgi:hypothetical protein